MQMRFGFFVILLLSSMISGVSNAYAIEEGGACNIDKFENSLVMKNGKIHGGISGSNENYIGPLYLCEFGSWTYWKTVSPAKKSTKKVKTVAVTPGQICNSLGQVVQSTNSGKLKCKYVRVGRIQVLMWFKNP